MKKLIFLFAIMLSLNSVANTEFSPEDNSNPTQVEIEANRSCFKDLVRLGCGDPGEDIEYFRRCMNNVFPSLKDKCKTLMNDLYKSN